MNRLPLKRRFFAVSKTMIRPGWLCALLASLTLGNAASAGSRVERAAQAAIYPDGRPAAKWRLEAQDEGIVLRHGGGPGNCDALGGRDVWVWQHGGSLEYTDAIWVYWSRDLTRWNRDHKAVVLDRKNCKWSKHIIGLPSVVKAGSRLAVFYDGNGSAKMPGGVKSHMGRDVGLAWLDLPLIPPVDDSETLRKGDVVYQADFEGSNALSGWSGAAVLEPGYASPQAVALEVKAKASGAILSRHLPAEALRGCRVRGSVMVRAEQVSPKPNPWNGIKFMLIAESPAGKSYPQATVETGTLDWRRAAFAAYVPADATNLMLVLGLEQVTGKVWFDDLKLTVAKAPLVVQPEPVAGPVFKGHSLPRLRGAMVSPGIDPESLRVLGQDWKANLIRFCDDWQALAERAARAIRAIDPERALIVEPAQWGSPEGLNELVPIAVSNVVYSVHMYLPHAFTHQGVYASGPAYRYPGLIEGKQWDKAQLERALRPAIAFQERYHVHLYIGEFSAIRWAPDNSACRYLGDLIDIFEAHGWDWSYHAFREWSGWSVEHGPDRQDTRPAASPTERQRLLCDWFARNQKPRW